MALYDEANWENDGTTTRLLLDPKDTNYPDEGDVRLDVDYGIDFDRTGTANDLTVARPSTPSIRIRNNQDDTATATITGSDAGTTNTVLIYLLHGGALILKDAGSRVGDGTLEIDKPRGQYSGYVVSELDNILSLPSNPDTFWITSGDQYNIRTAAADAELLVLQLSQYGVQVEFKNGDSATGVVIWGSFESGGEVIQLRNTVRTDLSNVVFHAPRQPGFPPEEFATGATIAYDEARTWEIDSLAPSNGINELSSSFRLVAGSYRSAGNY